MGCVLVNEDGGITRTKWIREESVSPSAGESSDSSSGELRVGFTVVPGFKIGKTVIQSQVYLSLVGSPATS